MLRGRDVSRKQKRPRKHPSHECAKKHGQRDRRRADNELQNLEPDNFVDERRAPGADEEKQHRGEVTAGQCGG
jgi:hypothetical protein